MKKILMIMSLMAVMSAPAFAITPPYFGYFYAIQGLSYIPSSGDAVASTDFGHGAGIELMLGNKAFFYMHGTIFIYPEGVGIYPKNTIIPSVGFGAGYRVLDLRQGNKGHSIATSLTFSMRPGVSFSKKEKDSVLKNADYFCIGGEFFTTYYYNIYKHLALRLGLNFGVFHSEWYDIKKEERTGLDYSITHAKGLSITYGLSLGLAF